MKNAIDRLIWLDDVRDPFKDGWIRDYAPEFVDKPELIIWIKNYDDFISTIKCFGLPYMIAFDHDLGEDVARQKVARGLSKRQARIQKRETKSGFDCAKWLVDYCLDNNKFLPKWVVQSANPVGKENINGLLNGYKVFSE